MEGGWDLDFNVHRRARLGLCARGGGLAVYGRLAAKKRTRANGAAFQVADSLDLFEPVQEHFAQHSRCPLAEPCAFNGLYAIADRNDHIEVVVGNLVDLVISGSVCKFCIN